MGAKAEDRGETSVTGAAHQVEASESSREINLSILTLCRIEEDAENGLGEAQSISEHSQRADVMTLDHELDRLCQRKQW